MTTNDTNDHSEAIRTITDHAKEITRGSYKHTEELQRLADESVHSPGIAGLAEAFGMMSVKVEAREFALQQKNAELAEALKLRTIASRMLLWFAFSMSLYIFLMAFFYQPGLFDTVKPILIRWFGMAFLLSQVALMIILIRKSGLSLSDYGVTTNHWKKSLMEGLAASGAVILGLFFIKLYMVHTSTVMEGMPVIALEELNTLFTYTFIVHAPFQEFIARGVLQSSAKRIMMGKRRVVWAIVSVSLIFSALHSVYSLPFALITLASSLLWGVLYERNPNLIGVSVCHILMGLAFIFFGFWEIIAF